MVDVALDTVPNALNDAKSGANGKEVGINAAKNLAANIGFNAVGEAAQVIPYLGMNLKNYGKNDKAYAEAMENIAKRNQLSPLEDYNSSNDFIPLLGENDLDNKRKSIMDQLKSFRNGELASSDRIDMGELPQYLENYGTIDNPTYMNQKTVNKVTAKKGTKYHAHGLKDDDIGMIPYDLNSPAAVMKSATQPNSALVVSSRLDGDGSTIVIPVHMDKNSNTGSYNQIPSIYGKDDIAYILSQSEKNGTMLFKNKEKVDEILSGEGLQLPKREEINNLFFSNSISNSAEKVNTPITDYKKVKINNHDDLNSQIDKYVGMYGDDAAKQKAVEVKEAMNKVLSDNSDEAWEDAIMKTQELDNMGQTSYDIADALINSDFYSGLSDSDKAKYLSDIYSVSKGKAKKDLFGSSTSDSISNQIAIYEEGGAEGLVKEMQTKYEITSRGLTVSDKTRQIYEEGGAQALDEYASYKGSVEQSGLTASDKTQNIYDSFGNEGLELYSAAKTKLGDSMSGSNLIPFLQDYSLSDSQKGEYISQFTEISDKAQAFADNGEYDKVYQYYNIKSSANSDGKGSLKKAELVDYLDRTGMSVDEKRTWFSILSTAKNPY